MSLSEWKRRILGENQVLRVCKPFTIAGLHVPSLSPIKERPDAPLADWAATSRRIKELSADEWPIGYVLVGFSRSDHKMKGKGEEKKEKFEYPRWRSRLTGENYK
jgi:hypothetical protein